MKKWLFTISYQSLGLVITGEATVVGNYSEPSKPAAMVRAALAEATQDFPTIRVVLLATEGPGERMPREEAAAQ